MVEKNFAVKIIGIERDPNSNPGSNPYIDALKFILEKGGVYECDYAIGTAREESTCLVNNGNKWEVFFYEKGQKRNIRYYERLNMACAKMIELLGDKEKVHSMTLEYRIMTRKRGRKLPSKVHATLNQKKQKKALG